MEGGRIVQCGTPREIFSAPASEYVAEFVANMNPLGVLTARDVMGPAQGDGPRVGAETPVRELIDRLGESDGGLTVEEDGRALGTVDARSIVNRLVGQGG
jgi:glycine betaine/proline transport system ATP-binding protein